MPCRGCSQRAPRAALALICAAMSLVLVAGDASAFASLGRRADAASSASSLKAVQGAFRAKSGSATTPTQLVAAADALGKLVSKARDLNPPAALFDAMGADADTLLAKVRTARVALEDRAGEDEAAIEALYRSTDWQRLDYSQVMLGYWRGWAALGRGQQLDAGSERRGAMEVAQSSFSRSMLELRLPKVATASLLGLGIAQRDLGEPAAAEKTLTSLLEQLQRVPDAQLDAAARYELASMALERGDMTRAGQLIAGIPKGRLTRADRLDLTRREAEGLLKRGRDLDRAAQLLRELLAAGDPHASHAAALAERHQKALQGRDLGALGSLLEAERAFAQADYPAARRGYASALQGGSVPGLNRANVEYKYAYALAETDALSEAATILERLTAKGADGGAKTLAAPLFYSVAERMVAKDSSANAQARALRAAERLLAIAPDAPGADGARYRAARGREARGNTKSSIAELEAIPEGSPAYAAARLDLVRLRGEELQRLEQRGRHRALRDLAPRLDRDIARVRVLIRSGELAADPSRDATLAVWAAKTAFWGGEKAARVDEKIGAARALSPGSEALRTLLRLELRNRVKVRQWKSLDRSFVRASDDAIRRDFAIWHEGLNASKLGGAPKGQVVRWYERMTPLSPERSRETLALGHAEALVAADRAPDAVSRAEALIEGDRYWADAWIVYADALDRSGDHQSALGAWRRIAEGTESGTGPWVDAKLRAAEAARKVGDTAAACRALEGLDEIELSASAQRRLGSVDAGCATP